MKNNHIIVFLGALIAFLLLFGNTNTYAATDIGEISWVDSTILPKGYVNHYVGDKEKAGIKRISYKGTVTPYTTLPDIIYHYDEFGNVLYLTQDYGGDTGEYVSGGACYFYDDAGRMIKYESRSRLGDEANSWTTYYYDSEGKLEKSEVDNKKDGHYLTYYYEYENGRIVHHRDVHDGKIYAVMGTHESFADYSYDQNGNLTQLYYYSWDINTGEKNEHIETYEYDELGRLIKRSGTVNGEQVGYIYTYEYDLDGYLWKEYWGDFCSTYYYETIDTSSKDKKKTKKQTISVKKESVNIPALKLSSKSKSIKLGIKAQGKIKCKKVSGSEYLSVTKAGKIKVKKGTPVGTYTIKIKVTASETDEYKSAKVTKTITVNVSS